MKWTVRIVLFLLFFLVLLWLLIRWQPVQQWVTDQVTNRLSKQLQTEVRIEKVKYQFFKRAILEGIYLEDRSQDTLLWAEKLDVDIGLFKLFGRQIEIRSVNLDHARIQLYRPNPESEMNYQFLIDAFSSDTTKEAVKSTPWAINLDGIELSNTSFSMHDTSTQISSYVGKIALKLSRFEPQNQRFHFSKVAMNQSALSIHVDGTENSSSEELFFPSTGLDFLAEKVILDQIDFRYQENEVLATNEVFEPRHMEFQNLSSEMNQFAWNDSLIASDIGQLYALNTQGFGIKNLTGRLRITNKEISVENLGLQTPWSNLSADVKLEYADFNRLADFESNVMMTLDQIDADIHVRDLNYWLPEWKQSGISLSSDESISLKGRINGYLDNLTTPGLNAKIGRKGSFSIAGRIGRLTNPNLLNFGITVNNLKTSITHLKRLFPQITFPDGLETWGQMTLSGRFAGGLKELRGTNVKLKTEGVTAYEGDLTLRNLDRPDQLEYELTAKRLTAKADELEGVIGQSLPLQLRELGLFSFSGEFKGNQNTFDIDGILYSEIGSAETDLLLDFSPGYDNLEYRGDIKLDTFDLGKFLGLPELGKLSVDLLADGKGLNEKDIESNLKGHIRSLRYLGYTYENLYVDGRLIRKKFIGRAQLDDPNAKFVFDGQADLNGDVPDLIFSAVIDTLIPSNLNLIEEPYRLSGEIFANLIGKSIDDAIGEISGSNVVLSNADRTFETPFISLSSDRSTNGKRIELESDFGEAFVDGDYIVSDLPGMLMGFLNTHFDLNLPNSLPVASNQHFNFEIQLSDPVPFLSVLDSQINKLDTGYLMGLIDLRTDQFELDGFIPGLEYGTYALDSIRIAGRGDASGISGKLDLYEIKISEGLLVPNAHAMFNVANDIGAFRISVDSQLDTIDEKFGLGGQLSSRDSTIFVVLDNALILNDLPWKIDRTNQLRYQQNALEIRNLNLYKPGQEILIRTLEKRNSDNEAPIEIGLRQFRLAEISHFLEKKRSYYDGRAIGNVLIQNPFSKFSFLADLNIEEFELNDKIIGTAIASARQRDGNQIDIDIGLYGAQNQASLIGTYDIAEQTVDLTADATYLELRTLDPFLDAIIRDSRGTVSGSIDIVGELLSPEIDGQIQLKNASTIIDFLQTRYEVIETPILFKKKSIDFGQIKLLDPHQNFATLSGEITYQKLTDPTMDLRFSTDRFQIINTTAKDNELFYGKIFVGGNATVRGKVERPQVVANVTTLDSTDFFVQPLTYEEALLNEDFIIFSHPSAYEGDSTINLTELFQLSGIGVDVKANITITPEAQLNIVVDPETGDQLICRGNADLVVDLKADGDISILGNYTLTSGQYTFVFQKVLRKQFEIDPGSTVTFVGDPLDTRFDVTAKYAVQTPTYPLIANESTLVNDFQIQQAREKSNVEVLLDFSGDLDEPQSKLDIVIPNSSGAGSVGSRVSYKLAQLKENESDLNLQVFSLLLFDAFVSLESSNDNFVETAGINVGLSTVSNLLTNQLNQLAKKFIKGVDLDFGVDSYRSGYDNTTITELQLGLRKRFLDDRLSVYVGGSLNNENQAFLDPTQNSNSTYSGDFVVEYKLTQDGNYQIRFSQLVSNEQTIFNQGANYYEAGVAIFFRKSFNSKRYRQKLQSENDVQE